jgi:tRNA A-37 threonylcarbamoyl transferase component Bud32
MSNLPANAMPQDSSQSVKMFFDKFFQQSISFPSNQIDAVVGFFTSKGFDQSSAESTSIVLLNQARADGVDVFVLLDSLKVLGEIELSQVVAQVLNAYREKTSLLGYRIQSKADTYETRNILV